DLVACQECAGNLIAVTANGEGAHPMDGDVIDNSGTCAVRTFTCNGFDPIIEMNGNSGVIPGSNGVATINVTCNEAGTAWINSGKEVTQVECASSTDCKACAADLITVTASGDGAHPMDGDVTDTSGLCAVRTFTCNGYNANIEVNSNGVVTGEYNVATFEVTCNGTAWVNSGAIITQLECAS
ncbi:hypothetical protein PFISCL1PPCAC_24426, partial [Pristionchus fissidentatus]